MKKRVRQAAMRLTLLQEEFTKSELDEAVSFLSNHKTEDLLEYFRETKVTAGTASARSLAEDTDRLSKAVQDLETSDPEYYRILSEFEPMVRKGEVLSSLDEVKRLGTTISKNFEPAKSRKDTIPRLMALLAKMPFDEMKETIHKVTERAKPADKSNSSYARLAEYLIDGTRGSVTAAGN
ncbi:hypothetical protein [Candidatus Thiosymbion oneisti]|uniref:hypothetical protein n=1 Tax=Candidatus Thiosymbion oneisti TaxID=589554 RepID=UPI00105D27AE|nr:hypothetical protein [Candidatus Thiosymbion oneisti]